MSANALSVKLSKNVYIGVDRLSYYYVFGYLFITVTSHMFDIDECLFAVIKIKEIGIGVRWGGADIVKLTMNASLSLSFCHPRDTINPLTEADKIFN